MENLTTASLSAPSSSVEEPPGFLFLNKNHLIITFFSISVLRQRKKYVASEWTFSSPTLSPKVGSDLNANTSLLQDQTSGEGLGVVSIPMPTPGSAQTTVFAHHVKRQSALEVGMTTFKLFYFCSNEIQFPF